MATTRLGLTTPAGTDLVANGDNAISVNATILDDAAIYDSGTYAARPAASAVAAGTFYWATDVSTVYVSDGTSWFTVNPADQAAGIASLRTLGTGAAQAAAGNDSRLSDARTPTGSAGGDLTGTYPNPTIGAGKVATSHQANMPAGRVYASSQFPMQANAYNRIQFPTTDFTAGGVTAINNGSSAVTALTAPATGAYIATVSLGFAGSSFSAGTTRRVLLRIAGTTYVAEASSGPNGSDVFLSCSAVVKLASGSHIDATYYHDDSAASGGGTALSAANPSGVHATMSLGWIGPA